MQDNRYLVLDDQDLLVDAVIKDKSERKHPVSNIQNSICKILPEVLKPTRYIGNEINSVRKELFNLPIIRFALAFPDIYEVGMSHLGLKILYGILNSIEDVWAERVFAPWIDMEEKMRSEHIELFSLESFTPLRQFDIIGFSLQYEMCYTNVLNMLELAKIPLMSKDRDDSYPLIIAGGPCAFNPEPIADFIDLFVIGDGEEVILEIIDCYRKNKGKANILRKMAEIEGVYVPSLYPLEEQPDGTLTVKKGVLIKKRVVSDINNVSYLSKYIVPFMKPIHDRAIIEVMRGCSRGCRFCQAGMIYRPVRERSPLIVESLAEDIIKDTGYEELSLSSLSSCDYSAISFVVDSLIDKLGKKHVSISLPSLRTDAFSVDLAKKIESVRKTGLTFAPESATERMQRVINKGISRDQVLSTIKDAFSSGWESVKLYFLLGLPTETDEDIKEIAELVKSALRTAQEFNKRASLNISVSTFVPKAHTPFQWERQITIEEIQQKQKLLLDNIGRNNRINISFNSPELSLMEGIFARGDRRLCRVLYEAHKLGCKLDGWSEHFNFNAWMSAFKKCQVDPYTYIKERKLDQVLPYDHIDTYVTKSFLLSERQKALNAELTPDCRLGKCSNCGICDKGKRVKLSISPRELPATSIAKSFNNRTNFLKASRIRFKFAKKSELRFISHLDVVNAFTRAFRRAEIPIAYSQGFNPHPKISFGSALAVGITSSAEFADIDLETYISPEDFLLQCNRKLPKGLEIIKAKEIPLNTPSLMSQNSFSVYTIFIQGLDCQNIDFESRISSIMHKDSILINRLRGKDKVDKVIDIKPYIANIELLDFSKDSIKLKIMIGDGKVRPEEVVNLIVLGSEYQRSSVKKFFTLDMHKLDFFLENQGQFFSPI
ncbi:MAG: TIGR03960 family B12-binding radical SAM protein [bacterium]